MRTLRLATLTLVAVAPRISAQVPVGQAERVERIERGLLPTARVRGREYPPATIDQRMREHRTPAVSVAVLDSGRIVWAKAYGVVDSASGRAATTGTLFQAASMSKPVAASGALRLVEQGKLALDADVNESLRSWKLPASEHTAKSPVTLRMLLGHVAGLTVHGFPGYAAGAAWPSVVQVLDGAKPANTAAVRVNQAPGTRWRYSGGGTTVAQLMMTDATGEPFPALMRRLVLDPAGMRASTYEQPLPAARAGQAATGHDGKGAPVEGRYHGYPEMFAAGLWTTASDLARWITEIQRAHAGETGRVLTPASARAMLTPGLGNWGLGVALEGTGDSLRFHHGGANQGFRGQFVGYVHGGRGVVVLTNGDGGAPLAADIVRAVAQEYGWPGYATREIVPIAVADSTLRGYEGRYALRNTPIVVPVAREDGALWMTMPGGARMELVPTGADEFAAMPSGSRVRFERDAAGKVTALLPGSDRLARIP